MNVSIVIPNYNGEDILKKNLSKVLEASMGYIEGEVEIIISDDSSTDRSIQIIEEFIKKNKITGIKINLLKNEVNRGFSSNVNLGVTKAKNEIIVLLNTDVSPHVNFLKPLVIHFQDKEVFAVGCMDESIEEGKVVPRGRGVGKWRRGLLVHSAGDLDKTDTLWAGGGSSAFRKSYWTELGGMDSLYNPFYWEDIDLSYRALKSGYKIFFEKDSVVRHEHEKGIIKSSYSKSEIKKIAYRNQFIFVWKNSDKTTLITHILWMPYYLIKAILRVDAPFYKGLLSGILLMPNIIKERFKVQRKFKKSDEEVVGLIE